MTTLNERPLRISYEDLAVPHADCTVPATRMVQEGKGDSCHVVVTVTDRVGSRPGPGDKIAIASVSTETSTNLISR
jgi:hypothetical protein